MATVQYAKKAFCQTPTIIAFLSAEIIVDDAIKLLDAGVAQVAVTTAQKDAFLEAGIGASRLIIRADTVAQAADVQSDIYLSAESIAKDISLPSYKDQKFVVYASVSNAAQATSMIQTGIVPVITADLLTLDAKANPTQIAVASLYTARAITDRPDGLYTTVVTDVYDKSLGLVYSSAESISEALRTGTGVYQSRKHGLWYKGATSGATQKLLRIELDCDADCLKFVVEQTGVGFCHLDRSSCFGHSKGVSRLEATLLERKASAPEGSYTARLFNDAKLLSCKIMEEAEELNEAETKEDCAWEAADLIYFAMTKCVSMGVSWADVEKNLDAKGLKISRRKGDAKKKWIEKLGSEEEPKQPKVEEPVAAPAAEERILMQCIDAASSSQENIKAVLTRPVQKTADIMKLVTPIVEGVKNRGDAALIEFTAKFDHVELKSPILKAPFPKSMMILSPKVKEAIDLSIDNVRKFHTAQLETETLVVETAPGVICSRFSRPINSVGLYVPGGTAVLPSTALHLGVPAMVAGCQNIIVASPPRSDGTLTPEVVYVANKIGASSIVMAGGAQAIAAMAYGTETVPKVDKILGPGNQFVTAAKMFIQNDSTALCSIDMPAGPSEVLVIADGTANPAFVASDLLSQAEHGVDSQVILLAVDLTEEQLKAIENEVHDQAMRLPRVEIIRKCIAHSTTLRIKTIEEAMALSNEYAPEHLILQVKNAAGLVDSVQHAGSVFVGAYSPESCGDYSSGTNHTLPTYGYAKMYSGVSTSTFQKYITSQELTETGLKNIGHAVMNLAAVEGLDAHRMAVKVRMDTF
ncbi:histidinol dehydrogenase [Nadsonia fulvescens var. elongata DSM 6958]|uniref:Histidine biosynthesis trifunctional protein n=1 Tax=Nadsonia fulvescens var. elongata DSM 6958 TaxID=857566 RepID=A0A1E3PN90_9ASCO|nr:histidinol dehydrogenase [Nadsonia fulvescens var. elongata DSM 6958]